MREIQKIERKQHQDFDVVFVWVKNGGLEFVEYYLGVTKDHPLWEDTKRNTDPWELTDHKVSEECFKKGVDYSLEGALKNLDIITQALSTDNKREVIERNDLKSIDHAWLSYIGNDYEYLNDDRCYFGGGMCITNFGKNDSEQGAQEMIARMIDYFSQVKNKEK